jgi:hypothetical protein
MYHCNFVLPEHPRVSHNGHTFALKVYHSVASTGTSQHINHSRVLCYGHAIMLPGTGMYSAPHPSQLCCIACMTSCYKTCVLQHSMATTELHSWHGIMLFFFCTHMWALPPHCCSSYTKHGHVNYFACQAHPLHCCKDAMPNIVAAYGFF